MLDPELLEKAAPKDHQNNPVFSVCFQRFTRKQLTEKRTCRTLDFPAFFQPLYRHRAKYCSHKPLGESHERQKRTHRFAIRGIPRIR